MHNSNRARAVFLVTGSDTGVGKTVFTGLLGRCLSDKGVCLRLAKPFCSGGRGDIEFLSECGALGIGEVNYWYDDEPISPAAFELRTGEAVNFDECVEWVFKVEGERMKGEGEGGVLQMAYSGAGDVTCGRAHRGSSKVHAGRAHIP